MLAGLFGWDKRIKETALTALVASGHAYVGALGRLYASEGGSPRNPVESDVFRVLVGAKDGFSYDDVLPTWGRGSIRAVLEGILDEGLAATRATIRRVRWGAWLVAVSTYVTGVLTLAGAGISHPRLWALVPAALVLAYVRPRPPFLSPDGQRIRDAVVRRGIPDGLPGNDDYGRAAVWLTARRGIVKTKRKYGRLRRLEASWAQLAEDLDDDEIFYGQRRFL